MLFTTRSAQLIPGSQDTDFSYDIDPAWASAHKVGRFAVILLCKGRKKGVPALPLHRRRIVSVDFGKVCSCWDLFVASHGSRVSRSKLTCGVFLQYLLSFGGVAGPFNG